ncbi:aspartate--tRNA ligase [Candidatus Woesearchaeota archaeon]|nr:aspartate--tRNA ligase [Candidatus Woesearchaeota archaeon]
MLRTHNCGELTVEEAGEKVNLCGWVETIRLQGKIGFLLLKDRYGITQVFLNPKLTKTFGTLNKESIILITGEVKKRPTNQVKKEQKIGEIEVIASEIKILNKAEHLPLDLNVESSEETRLKFRYLDLRRKKVQHKLIMRYQMMKSIRSYMDNNDFIELETPILAKSTPEGARDYLVPSRIDKGKFFALPQSPQIFKQLFMVAGMDKYYQIARCLRDEDLRSDRQPEFTQLDVEMSFIDEEDVIKLIEGLMKKVFKDVLDLDIKIPFERIKYDECMKKYKTDKPNLSKNEEEFKFLWIIDFPLMEYSKEEKRFVSMNHPFTSPREEDIKNLETGKLDKIKARAYDLVLNGYEIGGGSIRIHDPKLQYKIFEKLKLTKEEIQEKFGFFINALKYGTPPHGGIALGLDRIAAIITKSESIRDVIAFPKNKDAKDLMLDSPSIISDKQLKELGLKLEK